MTLDTIVQNYKIHHLDVIRNISDCDWRRMIPRFIRAPKWKDGAIRAVGDYVFLSRNNSMAYNTNIKDGDMFWAESNHDRGTVLAVDGRPRGCEFIYKKRKSNLLNSQIYKFYKDLRS